MTRLKILAFFAIVALLTLVPASVMAQGAPTPHVFWGTVTMTDGEIAPDGTVVVAMVDGEVVDTIEVESSFQAGYYVLTVVPAEGASAFSDPTVTFTVDGMATVLTFTADGSTAASAAVTSPGADEVDLAATAVMVVQGESMTIGLFEKNNSGQTGMATLTELNDDLEVVVWLNPGALNSNAVHIHFGTCETLGDVDRALTFFGGGLGPTTVLLEELTLAHLQGAEHNINVHWEADGSVYTACGNIPAADADNQSLPMVMMAPDPVDTDAIKADLMTDLLLELALSSPSDGSDGADGQDGAAGATGATGATGSAGSAGSTGADGAAGAAGDSGQAGATGAAGPEGDSGGGALAVIALILAIVALVGAGGAFAMSRRS